MSTADSRCVRAVKWAGSNNGSAADTGSTHVTDAGASTGANGAVGAGRVCLLPERLLSSRKNAPSEDECLYKMLMMISKVAAVSGTSP